MTRHRVAGRNRTKQDETAESGRCRCRCSWRQWRC